MILILYCVTNSAVWLGLKTEMWNLGVFLLSFAIYLIELALMGCIVFLNKMKKNVVYSCPELLLTMKTYIYIVHNRSHRLPITHIYTSSKPTSHKRKKNFTIFCSYPVLDCMCNGALCLNLGLNSNISLVLPMPYQYEI